MRRSIHLDNRSFWFDARFLRIWLVSHVIVVAIHHIHPFTVVAQTVTSIDDYKHLVEQQRSAVRSMLVSYEYRLTKHDAAVLEKGLLDTRIINSTATIAFSENKRFSQMESSQSLSSGRERKDEHTAAFTGDECRIRTGKSFRIQREKSFYTELNSYLSLLMWPPSQENSQGDNFVLPNLLDSNDWVIESDQIRGAKCMLLSNRDSTIKIWLDPAMNYAIVRYWRSRPLDESYEWTFDYFDHIEVINGFYLPRRITTEETVVDLKTKEPAGKVWTELIVGKLQVNGFDDSIFNLEPRPGEMVIDAINNTVYTFLGSDDKTLERSIEFARGQKDRFSGSSPLGAIFIALNIVFIMTVVGACIGYWMKRARRKK